MILDFTHVNKIIYKMLCPVVFLLLSAFVSTQPKPREAYSKVGLEITQIGLLMRTVSK